MTQIKGADLAAAKMGRWSPNDLAYVLRLDFRVDESRTSSSILLVALFQLRGSESWPDPKAPLWEVTMRFGQVAGLRVQFDGGSAQIMGFEIVPLAGRSWEQLRFEIGDYEDGRIAFMCAEIEIEDVRQFVTDLPPGDL